MTTIRPSLPALTGLRFVAALAVVLYHYHGYFPLPWPFSLVISEGHAGASLFFVLSGFILVYNYDRWFRTDYRHYGSFMRARLARIYPMHLVTLLLITPLALALPTVSPFYTPRTPELTAASWLANLTLIHAYLVPNPFHIWNGPSWSISAELAFYLLLPVFVRRVLVRCHTPQHTLRLAVGTCAIGVGLYLAVVLALYLSTPAGQDPALPMFWLLPPLRIWEFFFGCALGWLFLQAPQASDGRLGVILQDARQRNRLLIATIAAVVGSAVAITSLHLPHNLNPYVLYTPLFGLLILLLAAGTTFLTRPLSHPLMMSLGEASYSLYLLHWLPLMLLAAWQRAIGPPPLAIIVATLVATLAVSMVLYLTIERPARHLLRGRPVRIAAASDGYPSGSQT